MTDLQRVELDEAMEELVSGGDLVWRSTTDARGYNVWSEFNPDAMYYIDYSNVVKAKRCVKLAKANNPDISDEGLIQVLIDNNYIIF